MPWTGRHGSGSTPCSPLYCAVSAYLLHLFYADLKPYFDLGLVFLVADLWFDGMAIYASGADASWLFFLAIFRVVDQTPISTGRSLFFAQLAPVSYLGVLLYVVWVDGRTVPVGPELAKLTVIYAGGLYTAMVARSADLRTRRLGKPSEWLVSWSVSSAQKSEALEASSRRPATLARHRVQAGRRERCALPAAQVERSRQQQIFNSTSDGIIFVRRDGRIEAANSGPAELLSFEPDNVIGIELARAGVEALLGRRRRQLSADAAPRCSKTRGPAARATCSNRRPGACFTGVAQPARDVGGDISGLTFTFEDVTRARDLVRQLEDKSRLLEDARLKADEAQPRERRVPGQRQPRDPDAAQRDHRHGRSTWRTPARAKTWSRRIGTSAESLMAIIDDILDFSKIESRKLTLERGAVLPARTVSDAIDTLRSAAAEKRLELRLDVATATSPTGCVGDPLQARARCC